MPFPCHVSVFRPLQEVFTSNDKVRALPLDQQAVFLEPRFIHGGRFQEAILSDIGRRRAAGKVDHPRHHIRPDQHITPVAGDHPQAVTERHPHIRQREGGGSHDPRCPVCLGDGAIRFGLCPVSFDLGAGRLPLPLARHFLPAGDGNVGAGVRVENGDIPRAGQPGHHSVKPGAVFGDQGSQVGSKLADGRGSGDIDPVRLVSQGTATIRLNQGEAFITDHGIHFIGKVVRAIEGVPLLDGKGASFPLGAKTGDDLAAIRHSHVAGARPKSCHCKVPSKRKPGTGPGCKVGQCYFKPVSQTA
ncbi:hypothetical protein D3C80_701770 [compost metagenome]